MNTSAPTPAAMFAPQVPEHAPATVAVTTAPVAFTVLEENVALVLSARM
ncbi:MAG: hypothetical protein M3546_15875 [Actinomycetota bacterium]|nr:hypothetical protein [Actinomycetota bacterium]